jgi:small conductance mechanosensitive channel
LEEISIEQISGYLDIGMTMLVTYGPPLLLAVVVLIVGLWIINRFVAVTRRTMETRSLDPTLGRFLTSLLNVTFKALLLISVASMIGIETTSFIAVLAAAGLAIGLALQGSLANFAGGVLVLMFRPFKVGDFIEAQGIAGTVAEIQIFSTVIKTSDNKVMIVPNGAISNGIITNYSKEATRRVDFVFGIGYGDDIAQARSVLEGLISADERILSDPPSLVVVSELADSSVNFTVRVWVNAPDYSGVYFGMTEAVKLGFDRANISIPFPQSDVHVHQA